MWSRVFVGWRNAHQADEVDAVLTVCSGKEITQFFRPDSSLLRFSARIDLDEEFWMPVLPLHFLRKRGNEPVSVHRLDDIKQGNRVGCLVCLQGPYQVKADAGIGGLQGGPFALRFLHPVLAKNPVARFEHGQDVGGIMGFAHCDQRDVIR